MSRDLRLTFDQPEQVCSVAKALSSPVRLEILEYLAAKSRNINEIAEDLKMPASSAALNVRVLEEAGLIYTEAQPGKRGSMKLCSRIVDGFFLEFSDAVREERTSVSCEMPLGGYTDCEIHPTCGIASAQGPIGNFDDPRVFYWPEHLRADLLWSTGGYVEYRLPCPLPEGHPARQISILAEICSEAPSYREDWKSDISLWINGVDCGFWTSPGSFGSRRGRLNPTWWQQDCTQYGYLTNWTVSEAGTFVNGKRVGDGTVSGLRLEEKPFLTIKIGNAPDAEYRGGFTILGKSFGDTAQDIVMTVEY